MSNHFIRILILMEVLFLQSCATTSSSDSGGGASSEKFTKNQDTEVDDSDLGTYADSKSLVQSLSNNPMTSRTINRNKVKGATSKFSKTTKGTKAQNIEHYEDLIAIERVAGVSTFRLLSHLKGLAESTVSGKAGDLLSENARLEVGLGALQQRQYSMASFFFEGLFQAKNKRVRAGAYNGMGIIALNENRVPEAAEYWRQALKEVAGYEASLLNLGFISLKFGHFESALRYLSRLSKDWFAQSGLLVASRLTSKTGETAKLCSRLLQTNASHKPTAFNCGIHEWQSNNNIAKAKKLISKALNLRGGPPDWDQSGYRILEKVR